MSFWWRVFRKKAKPDAAPAPRLSEQLRRKGQNYQQILAAEDQALAVMAAIQSLPLLGYASPAYVQLGAGAALSYARKAVTGLTTFTKQQVNLEDVLRQVEDNLNLELEHAVKALNNDSPPGAGAPCEEQYLTQIDLQASGFISPAPPDAGMGEFVIEAVWGWGLAFLNQVPWYRKYYVTGNRMMPVPVPEAPEQEHWLTWQPETGLLLKPLPEDLSGKLCLSPENLQKLVGCYHRMVAYLGGPVKLGWGINLTGEVVVLNAIRILPPVVTGGGAAGLLHSGGVCICPGQAVGTIYTPPDASQGASPEVPKGAVIWATRPAVALAAWLEKATALVVESGAPHNHLAFVARSLGVPTLFNTGPLNGKVAPGMVVRLDAAAGQIWDAHQCPAADANQTRTVRPATAADQLLARLAPWLFPLRLVDWSEKLAPANNRSLHELLYLTAQARVEEMFRLSFKWQPPKGEAVSLVTGQLVPIVMVDAGGGLSQEGPTVGVEAVRSIPFQALLKGMMSIPWPKGRPVDVRGFMSVIGSTTAAPRAADQLEKISFALITANYLNFSLCLGYHASTVEAYIGDNLDHNYLRFHYQGGAASLERRLRRLQLIGGILTKLGFRVKVSGDLLDARLAGESGAALTKTLEILGKLEVYTKQMDMLMSNDAVVQGYIDDFLATHLH